MNGLHPEIFLCRRIHVVARGHAVQYIGFQHGIETVAVERDLAVREDVGIVFQMMAQLGLGGIFQDGLEGRQDLVAIQLMRRAGVIVTQRHVGGFSGTDRESHADHARLHVVQAVGLGIEGDQRRGLQLLQPAFEHILRHDLVIFARARSRHDGRCLDDGGTA